MRPGPEIDATGPTVRDFKDMLQCLEVLFANVINMFEEKRDQSSAAGKPQTAEVTDEDMEKAYEAALTTYNTNRLSITSIQQSTSHLACHVGTINAGNVIFAYTGTTAPPTLTPPFVSAGGQHLFVQAPGATQHHLEPRHDHIMMPTSNLVSVDALSSGIRHAESRTVDQEGRSRVRASEVAKVGPRTGTGHREVEAAPLQRNPENVDSEDACGSLPVSPLQEPEMQELFRSHDVAEELKYDETEPLLGSNIQYRGTPSVQTRTSVFARCSQNMVTLSTGILRFSVDNVRWGAVLMSGIAGAGSACPLLVGCVRLAGFGQSGTSGPVIKRSMC
jgi:hypothetical protein